MGKSKDKQKKPKKKKKKREEKKGPQIVTGYKKGRKQKRYERGE